MKTAVFWVLPILAVSSIGSMTFATSHPIVNDNEKKRESKGTSKLVSFKHDREIDKYLTSISSFMLVPPRDGRFGASRVPTFHGSAIRTVPGYKEIEALGNESSIASFVVGAMPKEMVDSYAKYKISNPEAEIPKVRSTLIHFLMKPGIDQQNIHRELRKIVEKTKEKVDKEGYDAYSEPLNVPGISGNILAKAIRASDKSCFGCHATIKPGEPIGYVMAAIWNKAP